MISSKSEQIRAFLIHNFGAVEGKFRINRAKLSVKYFSPRFTQLAVIDIKYLDVRRNFIKNFDVRVARQHNIPSSLGRFWCSLILVPVHFGFLVDDYGIHNLLFLFCHISGKMFREVRWLVGSSDQMFTSFKTQSSLSRNCQIVVFSRLRFKKNERIITVTCHTAARSKTRLYLCLELSRFISFQCKENAKRRR